LRVRQRLALFLLPAWRRWDGLLAAPVGGPVRRMLQIVDADLAASRTRFFVARRLENKISDDLGMFSAFLSKIAP
jgi:hypothetical protein